MGSSRRIGILIFTIGFYSLFKCAEHYGIEKDFWVTCGALGFLLLIGAISEIKLKNYIRADNLFLAKSKDEIADDNEPVTVEEINENVENLSTNKEHIEIINKKRGE